MATKPSSLLRVPIEVPNRSGHNLSHSHSFSGMTGQLIPVVCQELLPNDTVSLGSQLQVQLPPMVTDFYGKVDFVLEAFFVPNRLCWGGWQDFITHPTANPQYPEGTLVQAKPTEVPGLGFTQGQRQASLANYLGCNFIQAAHDEKIVSILPFIAYHRIWDDWYRDSRVQAPLFYRSQTFNTGAGRLATIPFASTDVQGNRIVISSGQDFIDGWNINKVRQRNWVKDYFTSASILPQAGGASEVEFDTLSNTSTGQGTGAFTISTLRAANSIQKWMERNNLAGYRYSDQIYAQFGRYPSDAIMDRPLYLGRNVQTVYNRSVFVTGDSSSGPLGTKGASSQALGEGSLVDSFTSSEHGFLMVLASLVPRPIYSGGSSRMFNRLKVGDFAFPLLAGMGDQEILQSELRGVGNSRDDDSFGYTDLYAEYKFVNDRVTGLLEDGYSLDSYVLQRSFDENVNHSISNAFLQIPTGYLDQVQAVSTAAQGYTYWAEIYFPFKKISTIPAYSQPTLADLKNAHTEYISRGGRRL